MKTVYIYVLRDPRNNDICYIGKTKQSLKRRLDGHICEIKYRPNLRTDWIKELLALGFKPIIQEFDVVLESEWKYWEIYYIALLRFQGYNLTNMTDGGEGNNGQVFSKETIEKRARKLRGIPRPKEVRDKISEGHKGKILSDITKEKLRIINLGKKYSEESKSKKSFIVLQYDLNGVFVREWKSINEAHRTLNISKGAIASCCKEDTQQYTAGGFIWRRKDAKFIKVRKSKLYNRIK